MTQEKLNKKNATHEISICLGEVDVANEKIKDIEKKLEEDYGKDEAKALVSYARTAHRDKVEQQLEKDAKFAELHEEISGS